MKFPIPTLSNLSSATGVHGIGIDLVHIPRFQTLLSKSYAQRFLNKSLNIEELKYVKHLEDTKQNDRKITYVAGR
jgi:phosphopantetheinyl transferase (holo-ACP synthase)